MYNFGHKFSFRKGGGEANSIGGKEDPDIFIISRAEEILIIQIHNKFILIRGKSIRIMAITNHYGDVKKT